MIYVKNSPNNVGVFIYGDHLDFERLYEALHEIVGAEDEYKYFNTAQLRVLGVCYNIRHAMQGDRELAFVDNGMHPDKMKMMGVITPDKNVYLRIEELWPEILFVTMALNDFILLHIGKKAKGSYHKFQDPRTIWDQSVANVRMLQAAVISCLKETVSETSFKRMLGLMNHDYTWMEGYATQWVDVQNIKFIKMASEKRQKSISIMAKRLADIYADEYRDFKGHIYNAAREYNTTIDNIRITDEYPDDWEW